MPKMEKVIKEFEAKYGFWPHPAVAYEICINKRQM
jgi:hypothetical protein